MLNNKYRQRNITPEVSLINALEVMDDVNSKLLLIEENNKFIGLLSIGDIQRAILNQVDLNTQVSKVVRPNPRIANPNFSMTDIKELMMRHRMEFCPVVDKNNNIKNIVFWEDLVDENKQFEPQDKFNLPVVIMAGGFGTRLRPITHIIPKPLIPIGDKTIIERIIERFKSHGCNSFLLSVNYKAELIKYYLNDINLGVDIDYFIEEKPLGTAGSLNLLKGKIDQPFFVSNCDILIEQDYSEILKLHKEQDNEITILAAVKTHNIPYGTLNIGNKGELLSLTEKPTFHYFVNAGMYILQPNLLEEIPDNEFYHITSLIEKLLEQNRKVGVFPVSEGSWMDVGQWDEYNKTNKKLGFETLNL